MCKILFKTASVIIQSIGVDETLSTRKDDSIFAKSQLEIKWRRKEKNKILSDF